MNSKNFSTQTQCPDFLHNDCFETSFTLKKVQCDQVWQSLQRRETFVKGQIPPYKVEFATGLDEGEFEEGELNIHHGPLLSVHGAIGEITSSYRSLHYFYGSYVLSFRLVRPTLLEFFREGDTITLKIHCFVAPYFKRYWHLGNKVFWKFFGISFLF